MKRNRAAPTKASDAAQASESGAEKPESAAGSPGKASGEMGVTEHLRELRNRLIVCLAALLLCMGAGLAFADRAVRALLATGEAYGYRFVYLSPQEMLLQYVSVAFVCAVCVTLPVALYEVWAFLRPGLKRNERVFYILTMLSGLAFAALGILFAAKALIPFMLRFLMTLNRESGAAASVSVQNYVSFLLTIFVIFAVVFELPVATVLLTQLGLVKIEWLKRARRVMIVVTFFVAAVITPPDIVSQVMVALPLLGLYEFSILVSALAARLRKPNPEEE
ncbi:MAG: twin-arginine translocase subunit TatC [Oscillibacter sp.]|nr:twin-arginine translocase subunit TatC [Oscillibacter sp.]